MKNFKRILLALVAVFAAVLLVACGAKSDNGTYVYKPSKTEVKEILEEQVDQQKKTLQSKTGEGEKVKYKVSGDVFTFDLSGEKSSGHEAALEMFKNAKFKRTK